MIAVKNEKPVNKMPSSISQIWLSTYKSITLEASAWMDEAVSLIDSFVHLDHPGACSVMPTVAGQCPGVVKLFRCWFSVP